MAVTVTETAGTRTDRGCGGSPRSAAVREDRGRRPEEPATLVARVVADPDGVPLAVLRRAVGSLERVAGASLGSTGADPRVVLQRRFGRALARSGRG